MDKDIISTKIETIRRCLHRVKLHTPDSWEALAEDFDAQDIISINLERAIQACVDISAHITVDLDFVPAQTMSDSFNVLYKGEVISKKLAERMKKSVGFRNISVHEYKTIDWKIVYSICTDSLKDFVNFIKEIESFCKL